jgi:hypothetical protein
MSHLFGQQAGPSAEHFLDRADMLHRHGWLTLMLLKWV